MVPIKLELRDAAGTLLSDNFYRQAHSKWEYKPMNQMGAALTETTHPSAASGGESHTTVSLADKVGTPAIAAKLTLVDASTGERILPAYYGNNYISLLPSEGKTVSIAYPQAAAHGAISVKLRGWNIPSTSIAIAP